MSTVLTLSERRALRALIGYWIGRCTPAMRRMVLAACGFLALFLLTGSANGENISALLGGTGAAFALPPVAILFRDKTAGDIEMVTGLPVRSGILAASLYGAAALVALPGAIAVCACTLILVHGTVPLSAGFAVAMMVGFWILLCFVSWTLATLGAALSETTFMNGPVAVIGVTLLAAALAPPLPRPQRILEWLLTPAGSVIAGAATLLALALATIALFGMMCRAMQRHGTVASVPVRSRFARFGGVRR